MSSHAIPSVEDLQRTVRVLDPASRDQDRAVWRRGRFAERVRREWNQVRTAVIDEADGDLDALADAIHAIEGGKRDHIRARLAVFEQIEKEGDLVEAADTLVRPGRAH